MERKYFNRKILSSITKYSYLNNAYLSNETCLENTKICGISDNFGNKLCLTKRVYCPINAITVNKKPKDNNNYINELLSSSTSFNDLTVYYSTKAETYGKL